MTWLVTGGAGYIGSHVLAVLRERGIPAVAYDDLSTGRSERVRDTTLIRGDIADARTLGEALRRHAVRGVVHLAAKKDAAESVRRPLDYYRENVEGTRRLLEAMADASVDRLVFSSSAAVYGGVHDEPVDESAFCSPANPYGWTKLIGEQLIADVAAATGLRWACLRYFNVSGARSDLEADLKSPSLISAAMRAVLAGERPVILGDDYPTPDGTCVRDYVHVADLADAHGAAVEALESGEVSGLTVNVGTGRGYSVQEVLRVVRSVAGADDSDTTLPLVAPRRPGDVARSLAAVDRIAAELGWRATRDLEDMVRSTFDSMRRAGAVGATDA